MSRVIIVTNNENKRSEKSPSVYNSDRPDKWTREKEELSHDGGKKVNPGAPENIILPSRKDGLDIMPAYKYIWENAPKIEKSIKESMSKAPYQIKLRIKPLPMFIRIKYMFIWENKIDIDFSELFKNDSFNESCVLPVLTGYVFNACLKQMNDPLFIQEAFNREKEGLLSAVQSQINTNYEVNDRYGLYIEDGKIYSCGTMKKECIGEYDSGWLDINDYLKTEDCGPAKPIKFVYMPEQKKDRVKKAVEAFNKAFANTKIYITEKVPYVEEIANKRSEIMDMHNVLLDGMRIRDIFPKPKMYYIASDPDTIYIETSVGTFSSCTDWAFVEYKEEYSENAAEVVSEEYQKVLNEFREAEKETGYTLSYSGGAGLMNAGKTMVVVDNGKRTIGVEIEIKKPEDFKKDVQKTIKKIKRLFDEASKAKDKSWETYLNAQMADTTIREEKKKIFGYNAKNIYNGSITQMMFLYVDKNGGKVTKTNFDKFCKDKCHADDCQDIMMEKMNRLNVMYDDGKHVFIGPKAKYMRLFVYERLGIDETGVQKALKDLEKINKDKRKERDENAK